MCVYVYTCIGSLYMRMHMHVCSGACISVYVCYSVCVYGSRCIRAHAGSLGMIRYI